jgi:hypothetical protein
MLMQWISVIAAIVALVVSFIALGRVNSLDWSVDLTAQRRADDRAFDKMVLGSMTTDNNRLHAEQRAKLHLLADAVGLVFKETKGPSSLVERDTAAVGGRFVQKGDDDAE